MTLEIALLFGIIGMMILLLAIEIISADTVAFLVMVVLIVGGFVTPEEGISGMSNSAAITVLSLMILTVGLESTGAINALGKRMKPVFKQKQWLTILLLMVIVATSSAFIATTAVVIVFLRVTVELSKKMPTSLSKLLMPLSFAGIMGGSCTLMGTSTNLLVSSIAVNYGMPRFGIFEFSILGMIFFAAGLVYMLFVGRFLIPDRQKEGQLTNQYAIQDYLTEVKILEGSSLIGKRLEETNIFKEDEMDVLEIKRGSNFSFFPRKRDIIRANDILLVKGSIELITDLRALKNVEFLSRSNNLDDAEITPEDMTLCEVIIRPNSRLLGKSLNKETLWQTYNAVPLAVKKRRKFYISHLDEINVEPGDTVLMEVSNSHFQRFYNMPEFVVLQEHENMNNQIGKRYIAALIVAAVILLAALNILPIMVSALAGCAAMLITGCLTFQRVYRRVDWSVYILLAGVIPLGIAMDNTGASKLISETFLSVFGAVSPRMLVSMLFIFTAIMSTIISNNATAILIAPIAISIAVHLNLDPRPLLFTIMFAANTSYASPIGYQTNTLIYGPGEYRFIDFFKVGGLLTLLIWGLATLFIPMLYF